MKKWSTVLGIGLAFGCADKATTAPVPLADFAVAGSSGCATVKFNVSGSVFAPAIPFTGDIEGSVSPNFGPGTKFAGVTEANGGTATFRVTGGVLDPLEFEAAFGNRNLLADTPGSPLTLNENIGTVRALSGVREANLTYRGTFSFITFEVDHDYHGVICP